MVFTIILCAWHRALLLGCAEVNTEKSSLFQARANQSVEYKRLVTVALAI
jgi:hypothetical protein